MRSTRPLAGPSSGRKSFDLSARRLCGQSACAQAMPEQHDGRQGEPGLVGHRQRSDQQGGGAERQQAFKYRHRSAQITHGHRAPQHNGQNGLGRHIGHTQPGPVALQHELRVVHRHIRHNEARQRDLRGLEANAHRRSLGHRGCGERGQRHGRREVGHDAEIEHEHVADDERHAQLEQGGRGNRTGDDVVRDSGNAHAQNQTDRHGEQQREQQAVRADVHDEPGKARGRAGEGEHTDDHADDGAGDAHGQGLPGAVDQAVAQNAQRLTSALDHQVDGDQRRNDPQHRQDAELQKRRRAQTAGKPEHHAERRMRNSRGDGGAQQQNGGERQPHHAGEHRGEAVEQHPHQRGQRQGQMPVFLQRLPGVGNLVGRQAEQFLAPRLQMHHPERGEVVERGRNDGGLDDVGIRHIEGFGHDEGHRAHDWRHDLPAHAGRSFHRPGEHRRVAEALHQRNGELAYREHIGHAGAGDGAHQSGRDDGHLGRAAARLAHQPQRQGVEQPDHAGMFEKRAEQNEQKDVGRRHQGGNAVDALGAEIELTDDLVEPVAAVADGIRQVLAEQAVEQKGRAYQRQRQAQAAPGRLEQQHHHRGADPEV